MASQDCLAAESRTQGGPLQRWTKAKLTVGFKIRDPITRGLDHRRWERATERGNEEQLLVIERQVEQIDRTLASAPITVAPSSAFPRVAQATPIPEVAQNFGRTIKGKIAQDSRRPNGTEAPLAERMLQPIFVRDNAALDQLFSLFVSVILEHRGSDWHFRSVPTEFLILLRRRLARIKKILAG